MSTVDVLMSEELQHQVGDEYVEGFKPCLECRVYDQNSTDPILAGAFESLESSKPDTKVSIRCLLSEALVCHESWSNDKVEFHRVEIETPDVVYTVPVRDNSRIALFTIDCVKPAEGSCRVTLEVYSPRVKPPPVAESNVK